jgi:hypothetical protein
MGFHPDMGNIPSWIGAGSLLLAFRIFLRDRSRSDRAQVDTVGIWGDIERDVVVSGGPRNDDVKVQIRIKNASDAPIEVNRVAFTFHTQWVIPTDDTSDPAVRVRRCVPGRTDVMRFMGPIGIAPQTTWEGQWIPINLTHTAPAEDAELFFFSDGVKCVILYSLITDNAGRRWEARQRKGKAAKRIRWYSRSGTHYPVEWQNPIGRRFRIFKAKAKEQSLNMNRHQATSELPKGPNTTSTSINQ